MPRACGRARTARYDALPVEGRDMGSPKDGDRWTRNDAALSVQIGETHGRHLTRPAASDPPATSLVCSMAQFMPDSSAMGVGIPYQAQGDALAAIGAGQIPAALAATVDR